MLQPGQNSVFSPQIAHERGQKMVFNLSKEHMAETLLNSSLGSFEHEMTDASNFTFGVPPGSIPQRGYKLAFNVS